MSYPHTLGMTGPTGSVFPVHHKGSCSTGDCRGCYPHTRSHQGIAMMAERMETPRCFSDTKIRAIIEVA